MPHITNKNQLADVLTTDTFEQWRVKTNSLIHAYKTLPADIGDGTIDDLKLGLNAAYNNIGATFGVTAGNLIDYTKLTLAAALDNLNHFTDNNTVNNAVGLKGSILRTGSVALNKLSREVTTAYLLGSTSTSTDPVKELGLGALRINSSDNSIGINSGSLDSMSVPLNKLQRTTPFIATGQSGSYTHGKAYILGSPITSGDTTATLVTPAVQQLEVKNGLSVTVDSNLAGLGINFNTNDFQISSDKLALSTVVANRVARGTAAAWIEFKIGNNVNGVVSTANPILVNSYNIASISLATWGIVSEFSMPLYTLTFTNGTFSSNAYTVFAYVTDIFSLGNIAPSISGSGGEGGEGVLEYSNIGNVYTQSIAVIYQTATSLSIRQFTSAAWHRNDDGDWEYHVSHLGTQLTYRVLIFS